MKSPLKTCITFVFLFVFYLQPVAQNTFKKKYLVEGAFPYSLNYSLSKTLYETSDSSFIASGIYHDTTWETTSSYSIHNHLYLFKTNYLGDLEWSKTLDITSNSSGFFRQTFFEVDNNYVCFINTGAGFSINTSASILMMKITENGNLFFQKRIYVPGISLTFNDVISTSDGGFALTGTYHTGVGTQTNFYFAKLDGNGNIIWDFRKGIGGAGGTFGHSVVELDNGDFAIVGVSGIRGYITKFDSSGNQLWEKIYEYEPGIGLFNSIEITQDGNFLVIGSIDDFPAPFYEPDITITKINPDGNLIWVKALQYSHHNIGGEIEKTLDDHFIISGQTGDQDLDSPNSGAINKREFFAKINEDGQVLWTKSYAASSLAGLYPANTSYFQFGKCYVSTFDEGYAFCQYDNNPISNVPEDLVIIKTDADGYSFCGEQNLTFQESIPVYNVFTPQASIMPSIARDTIEDIGLYNITININTVCESFCLPPTLDSANYMWCDEGCVQFPDPVDVQTEGTTYEWLFSNGLIDSIASPEFCLSNNSPGPETVDLTINVTTRTGCTSTAHFYEVVTVGTTPEAQFSFEPDSLTLDNLELNLINESSDAFSFEWHFGNGSFSNLVNPINTYPPFPGNYLITLTAKDISGNCIDTYKSTISLKDEVILYVPNTFTPGSDNPNFIFKPIVHSGVDPYQYHLVIYNRWGEVLFESFDYHEGWDGTYLNDDVVPNGVYVWKIDFKETMSDKHHREIGHVMVLK